MFKNSIFSFLSIKLSCFSWIRIAPIFGWLAAKCMTAIWGTDWRLWGSHDMFSIKIALFVKLSFCSIRIGSQRQSFEFEEIRIFKRKFSWLSNKFDNFTSFSQTFDVVSKVIFRIFVEHRKWQFRLPITSFRDSIYRFNFLFDDVVFRYDTRMSSSFFVRKQSHFHFVL